MKKLITAFIVLIIIGCASTSQIVNYTHNTELPLGHARIYILRPGTLGGAVKMKIYANDKLIGMTGPKSYLCWDVQEGEYKLESSAENGDYFTVNAKAGKTYYILQNPKMGIAYSRSSLELLEEKDGQTILLKLKKPQVKYAE